MFAISEVDKERISAAIAAAERRTSGEIVAVVTAASDDYRYVPILWAAAAALTVPAILWPLTGLGTGAIYLLQLATFVGVAAVLDLPAIRIATVPRGLKHRRAHKNALEQFLTQDLHTTAARTGVLIFVSVAERYCEILADTGIDAKVVPGTWRRAVDAMTAELARGRVADGFLAAIARCGEVLAEHFPPRGDDRPELPDHLIVL